MSNTWCFHVFCKKNPSTRSVTQVGSTERLSLFTDLGSRLSCGKGSHNCCEQNGSTDDSWECPNFHSQLPIFQALQQNILRTGYPKMESSLMNNWTPFNPTSGRGYLSKKKHASANLTLSKFWKKQRRPHPRRLVGPKKISAVHWRTSLRWFFALGRWPKRQGKNTGFPKWSSNGSSKWKIANLESRRWVESAVFLGGDEEKWLGVFNKTDT